MRLMLPAALVLVVSTPLAGHADEPMHDIDSILDMQIENLVGVKVTTASKVQESALDAPASVFVVTARDIRNFGYRTLGDILRSMPGLQVSNDRTYQHMGVRGLNRKDYNARVLLLVNGQRMNENMYDAAVIDRTLMVEVDAIERVEFVAGPGSSIYGNNAMLGVINVITRKGKSIDGVRVAGEVGSQEARRGYAELGREFENGADLMLSVSAFRMDGEDLYFPEQAAAGNNAGRASNLDDEFARKLFGTFQYQGVHLNWGIVDRKKDVPTAPYGSRFAPPDASVDDQLRFLSGEFNRPLAHGLNATARASVNTYDFHNEYYFDVSQNKDKVSGRWWNGELKFEYTGLAGHRFVSGLEIQQNTRQDYRNRDLVPAYLWYDQAGDSIKYGVYLNDHVTLTARWQLDVGVRVDRYESDVAILGCDPAAVPECTELQTVDRGTTTNPRLALIYKPLASTALKAIYGTAFRAPNPSEMAYVVPPVSTVGNAEPEEFETREFIVEHFFHDNLKVLATLFQSELQGVIAMPDVTVTNTGDLRSRGIVLGLEWMGTNGQRLYSSYGHVDVEQMRTDTRADDAPRHNLKFGYAAPVPGTSWMLGGNLEYISDRRTSGSGEVSGYTLANLTLSSREAWKGVDVSASIYNLFDERYADPARGVHAPIAAIPQEERNFRVQVGYSF